MKIQEKLKILQDNHFEEWLETRQKTEQEESDRQAMFCVCGKLATGLHESGCKKFNNRITKLTVEKLEHLLMNFIK